MARTAILNLNMFTIYFISFWTQAALIINRILETHTNDFVFLFVEDVSQVGAQLLDFFLLFHDLLLEMSRLVLQLNFASHELVPLMHALYDLTLVCSLDVNAFVVGTIRLPVIVR